MSLKIMAVRDGLVAAFEPIARDFQVSGYMLGNPRLPGIQMTVQEVEYDWHSNGGVHVIFTIQALVGAVSDTGAQDRIDQMIDTEGDVSVKALIEADGTLGGVVSDTRVASCSGHRTYNLDGRAPAIGAEWTVDIFL